jgi:nucleoside-diphosphate-sugar epimerase
MKIFLTGASGFIGGEFLKLALIQGHEVTAVVRPQTHRIGMTDPKVTWLEKHFDELTEDDLAGADVVAHFAAAGVTPKPATWKECFEFNVNKSLDLLVKTHKSGVKRFIASGSYAEYGAAGLRFDPIPVDAPLEPTDPYASSKAACSIALNSYARANGLELYYGRIFSAYGEGQYPQNFWPQLKHAAFAGEDFKMTPGGQIRDFIPVQQVAEQFLEACAREDVTAGLPMVRNIASGQPVSLIEFARRWWQEWAATGDLIAGAVPYRANEIMRYVPLVER